jgi:hypothetical protein
MNLPIIFEGIDYKIANLETYKGDLAVIEEIIYFYFHTDTFEERKQQHGASSGGMGEIVGIAGRAVVSSMVNQNATKLPKLKASGLWQEGNSSKGFQTRMDLYIEQLKHKRSLEKFSSGLPIPLIIRPTDIKQISIGFTGTLKIDTKYEEHNFVIGFWKKSSIREALTMAKFSL